MSKTKRNSYELVIVTGAGFSFPAGVPTQGQLLYEIEKFEPDTMQPGGLRFLEAKEVVNDFLKTIFLRNYEKQGRQDDDFARKLGVIQLEDIYSLLDRAIIEGDVIPPFSETDLHKIRTSLDACIIYYMNCIQANITHKKRPLYEQLYQQFMLRYSTNWLTITTNWDTVWDDVLISACREKDFLVDYGPNIYWIGPDSKGGKPEPNRLGPRLLKLHGSFNWLACPQCHSIFVWPTKELGLRGVFDPVRCPRCYSGSAQGLEPRLRPLFLTPSLLKTVRNPTLRIIWDEAFCALSTTKEVIFIGYSLPIADHELRYLLRRGISRNTKVKVILHKNDCPARHDKNIQLYAEYRYKSLLGLSDDDFYYGGFESFFHL
ncbi:SIR2 family protein [Neomoorella mulderi]|uniref:Uncharacterized protein n=1 Tax=Moorella mulderi DSM 14980 TaxID=1122241 RepID=A0A151AYR7_9FIRM|nr:SIR2 family protein [Moorella mulderi]KYH32799.1 hypothetical protein MOMUL_14010 [Moorella mulderi DSM 14980]